MSRRGQLTFWLLAACVSVGLLVAVLRYGRPVRQPAYGSPLPARPAEGRAVYENKGCVSCHGAEGSGTASGPALRERASLTSLPKLVIALWNHAPIMWPAFERRRLDYPSLSYQEASQLFAYLYLSGIADSPGDADRGAALWTRDGCVRCHGQGTGERLAPAGDSIDWTQQLWNHAAGMRPRLRAAGLAWPDLSPEDLRDLLAHLRLQNRSGMRAGSLADADPDRGWQLFQQKGCIRCHSVMSGPGGIGPVIGGPRPLPPTLSAFGASLLNHVPQMEAAVTRQGATWPTFARDEVRDLTVFFYSLQYQEPAGSPQIGKTVFAWRGCARCHGDQAQGGSAPRLRGQGTAYTSVRLATDLWRHGRAMYRQAEREQSWPQLEESDVGNLLAFLNSPIT